MATRAHFRFAVKLPKEITHTPRLIGVTRLLRQFLFEALHLGDKLGPLLVQLPPGFAFARRSVGAFWRMLRSIHGGPLVCEPRHETWFTDEADEMLKSFFVARVAADPARVPLAGSPGGWAGLRYHRLHGSPRMYCSRYDEAMLDGVRRELAQADVPTWCMFDNTALGAALDNALDVAEGSIRRGAG